MVKLSAVVLFDVVNFGRTDQSRLISASRWQYIGCQHERRGQELAFTGDGSACGVGLCGATAAGTRSARMMTIIGTGRPRPLQRNAHNSEKRG